MLGAIPFHMMEHRDGSKVVALTEYAVAPTHRTTSHSLSKAKRRQGTFRHISATFFTCIQILARTVSMHVKKVAEMCRKVP